MNYFYILLKLFVLGVYGTLQAFGTTYENAEDRKTVRWELLKTASQGDVNNIYHPIKKSRVIALNGDGTKSSYQLLIHQDFSSDMHEEKVIEWEMNYSEDFVIIISLQTDNGKRYLLYLPSQEGAYLQYGLGEEATDGRWHRYTRDLQKDLNVYEEGNRIHSIERFVIRGSGLIDNVKLSKAKQKVKKKMVQKDVTNSVPKIHIYGDNPIKLKKGEAFIDPGAVALDREDGEIELFSTEDVDIMNDGQYSVFYMATDSMGNTAVRTRYVEVGESLHLQTKDTEENLEKKEIALEEQDYENNLRLEERELEMTEWEKALRSKEQQLLKREARVEQLSKIEEVVH